MDSPSHQAREQTAVSFLGLPESPYSQWAKVIDINVGKWGEVCLQSHVWKVGSSWVLEVGHVGVCSRCTGEKSFSFLRDNSGPNIPDEWRCERVRYLRGNGVGGIGQDQSGDVMLWREDDRMSGEIRDWSL